MINALKLGAAALRGVPVPKPNEPSADYATRLATWREECSELEVYAGALAVCAAEALEAQDEPTKTLVARLSNNSANNTPRSLSDVMANGRSRADFNAAQAAQMRRRRASANNERLS